VCRWAAKRGWHQHSGDMRRQSSESEKRRDMVTASARSAGGDAFLYLARQRGARARRRLCREH